MRVYQLVHTLNYGDAISGEALTIRSLLLDRGVDSKIFSLHAHHKVKECRVPAAGLAADLESPAGGPTVLILHYSIGSPLNQMYLDAQGVTKVIIYHNLTPAKWYQSYNHRVATDLVRGREELPQLVNASDIVLADSEYNRSELAEFYSGRSDLLPLPLDSKKWEVAANEGIKSVLQTPFVLTQPAGNDCPADTSRPPVNLLHVGRTAPNKRIEDIIKIFYFYHHKINRNSRLWLIGSDIDNEIYSFELRRLVSELLLKEAVTFVGSVADSELRSFYETSDVYLCMSEHEGFCVPILEAMHFGLPVIAYGSCAVPETIGDAGILVTEKRHAEIAEMVDILVKDQDLRREIRSRAARHIQQFTDSRFLEIFDRLVLQKAGQSAGFAAGREVSGGSRK